MSATHRTRQSHSVDAHAWAWTGAHLGTLWNGPGHAGHAGHAAHMAHTWEPSGTGQDTQDMQDTQDIWRTPGNLWNRPGRAGQAGQVVRPNALDTSDCQARQQQVAQRNRRGGADAAVKRCHCPLLPPRKTLPGKKTTKKTPPCPEQCRAPHMTGWPGCARSTLGAACGNSESSARSYQKTSSPARACAHSALRCAGPVARADGAEDRSAGQEPGGARARRLHQ